MLSLLILQPLYLRLVLRLSIEGMVAGTRYMALGVDANTEVAGSGYTAVAIDFEEWTIA